MRNSARQIKLQAIMSVILTTLETTNYLPMSQSTIWRWGRIGILTSLFKPGHILWSQGVSLLKIAGDTINLFPEWDTAL